MSETFEFSAEIRQPGKHESRGLRKDSRVPAVVYGPNVKNLSISLSEKEVAKFAKQKYENTIFVLKSSDATLNNMKVLKKATSIHPVSRRPVHLDLFALDLKKAIRVSVEVRYEGKSVGVKEGGILNTVKRHVDIECLPTAIPPFLAVDVTNLGIGDSMHVSELQIPEGTKLITLPTETLCTVVLVAEEVVAAPVAAAADAAAAPGAAGAAPAAGAAAPAAGVAPAADAKAPKK